MIKKENIASIIIVFISISFVIVSSLLLIKKDNKKLVARKIALGAVILSLTAAVSCKTHQRTCYVAQIEEDFQELNDTTQTK